MTNQRYNMFPQMEDYDQMPGGIWVPFAMRSNRPNYKSNRINTDSNGFRYSLFKSDYISVDEVDQNSPVNFLLGGSTAFGVGSSGDDYTISSLLSKKTNERWLNLGIRAGGGLTEYNHMIRFVHKFKNIKSIVFFSGINDIYINHLFDEKSNYDYFFGSSVFNDLQYGLKRMILARIFGKIYNIDSSYLVDKSIKKMMFSPLFNNKAQKEILSDYEKMNNVIDNFTRNFILYSSLKKQLHCEVVFLLQPFAYWTGKVFSQEEITIFNELEEIQKNTTWIEQKNKIAKNDLYIQYVSSFEKLAIENEVRFIDSNPFYSSDKTLFVDAVHLTDEGNNVASEIILGEIK